ncbi:MAG: hypothetical protein P4L55_02605 [Syntrophobacteraceae bacterium]|nr:hypothetical protein [Syntrophobacteraceae bacterium]
MRRHASILKVDVLFFLAVILTLAAPGPAAAAQSASKTYFSSAQVPCGPRNQEKSRQQAVQNFMAQGLIQAIGSFLSPEQMGPQFDKLRKSVLAGPEKYIDTYQVYSEKQVGDQFQVVGKVTVSMNTLKEELVKLGVLASQKPPAAVAASPPTALAPTASPAAAAHPAAVPPPPASTSLSAPAPGAAQNGPKSLSRGIRPTQIEVLWAVVEKWDEKWALPTDSGDLHCIFARSMAKQMDGFGFSILLPQPGSVEMDTDGNIPPYQAVALAAELGVKEVVVGKLSYLVHRQSQEVSLNADLRVIRPGQDQTGVEIRKTLSMEDLSNQAGALELARRIAPRLSALLGGPKALAESGAPGSAEFPVHLGKLLIHLSSPQYSHWTELEKILRHQFQTMHIDDLQIGPVETSVNLNGVDGGYILKMDGTRLPSGVALRIDSYSTQTGAMNISFVSPAKVQAEPK